jgi:Zn-dependent protease with chaperone function
MNTAADVFPSFASPKVPRWSTERPLFVAVLLSSLLIWGLLALSIIGLLYAALIALFLFFSHVVFITHLRGSGVRLGPEQFPELWDRVVVLSRQAGMAQPPEAYLIQADGSLNAFATKLFRGRLMVLFTELLDACGEDTAARDMVIGHELGHLKLGHLDWFWLTAPGRFIPFLGHAYSRACEYSCDRWGAQLCRDRGAATRGLAILAAGGASGPRVNLRAFVAQRQALDTGWMALGAWLSNYPPLSARIEAIEPALGAGVPHSTRGTTRAVFLLVALIALPSLVAIGAAALWLAALGSFTAAASAAADASQAESEQSFDPLVRLELGHLADAVRDHERTTGEPVQDQMGMITAWNARNDDESTLYDYYSGDLYRVDRSAAGVRLSSIGPDRLPDTDDDLVVVVAPEPSPIE